MIKANFKTYASYVTDSLHQWDLNQVLQVSGLNLTAVPEIHFSNANTDRAIVRQATMKNHIVSVGIPNSLLQDPLRIYAHIGIYEGSTFKVVEMVEIPVIPRKRPLDYQIQTEDEEIYSFKQLENAIANMVTVKEANAISARIDTIVANANSTDGNSELVDIRVDIDGITHTSAGEAVREQAAVAYAMKTATNITYELGSITNGIAEPTTQRARFAEMLKACRAVVTIAVNDTYMFGYAVYDENGVYDGVDHGWNSMAGNTLAFGSGYFRMNFRRADNAAITETDLEVIASCVTVMQINVHNEIKALQEITQNGLPLSKPFALEVGSLAGGGPVDMANRARFVDLVPITAKTKVQMPESGTYMYGYAVYDENGTYDGVDHGWNAFGGTMEFSAAGYARFNFCRTDNLNMTEDDLVAIAALVTITTDTTVEDVLEDMTHRFAALKIDHRNALASVNVEYGRTNGASFIFARIPKTTNTGAALRPRLALTSVDGSIDGNKASALTYAQRNEPVCTINAGLFNTTTAQPVGQTIINGVVYVSAAMTDDMGSAISDAECYPLCIDANGDLSAPYARSIDTATMIADGVIHAVTGWGKVVENFAPCADTVENEIVHDGAYIRQVIGQFQNGDYCVCTVDMSRNGVENEAGITYADLAQLLVDRGVKFAYSLDGGGSAETVLGVRQLNPIYEGTAGRSVPTVIAFNIE